ncbi:MAG TPA: apolipoprotein N-acyltransferase [Rhizomicrobium sp.]|jgi:apolipoprotein N-acyltransferase|nr:apolipoprotein N-acyltransferase [Rhizomicrobium sp.]
MGASLAAAADATARFVRTLTGWRQLGFAVLIGAFSALGFVPFEFFPALLLGFAALVLLLDGVHFQPRPLLRAAFVGFAFGFGQFAAGMYWVGYAFLVDPGAHLWQLPLGISGLPALLAFFTAAGCAAAAYFWCNSWPRILVLTATYALAEWLRGHLFTGFPWNLPGYGWAALPSVLQSTAWFGVYGLTLLTVLFGASLAVLLDPARNREWLLPVSLTALFVVIASVGSLRETFTPTTFVPKVVLRIVQPNIPQAEKYLPQYVDRNWNRLLDLSRVQNGVTPTHIIWPESAPPFLLQRSAVSLDEISLLTAQGAVLMTGAVRADELPDGHRRFYNSFFIFGGSAQLIGVYDKFHLVPFGEYLPLEPLLSALGITKLVGIGSFASGQGPRTFHIPGAPPVGPLICYEAIFPNAVVSEPRPAWLVNVSDDSWFGPWAGPKQHLLIARVRAIEEGLPIVRGTNTGISAVIDPLGRVTASLGLDHEGVLDARLPDAIAPTPYARFGDLLFILMLATCALVYVVRTQRK